MDEATTIDAEFNSSQGDRRPPAAIMPAPPPRTSLARLTAQDLSEVTEEHKLLGQFVKHNMVVGTDHGVIPGTGTKKVLLKPGAEKLVSIFKCTPTFELVEKVQDWKEGFFHYEFRCRITTQLGVQVAEGVGSANSKEGRYRWRDGQRKCPECSQPSIFVSKKGEGYYCWQKKGGCGATFDPGDARIEQQPQGKVENDDVFTLVNTILKMAKKRALVDGAIALARCSDLFTQDVDDDIPLDELAGTPVQRAEAPKVKPQAGTYSKGPSRTCPKCKKPAIIVGKQEFGGGFVCFKAKGGCGAKFQAEAELLGTEGTPPEDPRATRVKKLVADFKAKQGDPSQMKEWIGKVLGQPKTSAELTDGELDQLEATVNIVEDIPF